MSLAMHSVQLSAEFKLKWVTAEGRAVTASQPRSPRAGLAAPVQSADQPSVRSLHVKGRIGKLCCTWLVDTGAVVSCVSAALPGINSIPRTPTTHSPVGANGLPLRCIGQISADLLIGPAAVSGARILVVENLSAPAILGTDVLGKFKTFCVDFRQRSLYMAISVFSWRRDWPGHQHIQ